MPLDLPVRWVLPTLAYAVIFGLLTAADLASTNWALRATDGREMNPYMLDPSTGMLSARFIRVHLCLLLACASAFAWGLARLQPGGARGLGARDALLSVRSDQGRDGFRWAFLAAAVLLMKALVPLSNVAEGAVGLGAPGLVRVLLGGWGEGAVLPVLIVLTVGVGFAFAAPLVRWTAARVAHA